MTSPIPQPFQDELAPCPPKRRGIFGGTFNPPHWGHLQVAQAALSQQSLAQVLWVPSYYPPHRTAAEMVDFEHRVELVRRAIAPISEFQVATPDGEQTDRSFAIHTLTHLRQQDPVSDWYWILGLDSFCTLPQWVQHQQLIPQCTWLVAPRSLDPAGLSPGEVDTLKSQADAVAQQLQATGIPLRWQMLAMDPMAVSSSLIRDYRRDRRPIAELVPPSVRDYIQHYNLYPSNS